MILTAVALPLLEETGVSTAHTIVPVRRDYWVRVLRDVGVLTEREREVVEAARSGTPVYTDAMMLALLRAREETAALRAIERFDRREIEAAPLLYRLVLR